MSARLLLFILGLCAGLCAAAAGVALLLMWASGSEAHLRSRVEATIKEHGYD